MAKDDVSERALDVIDKWRESKGLALADVSELLTLLAGIKGGWMYNKLVEDIRQEWSNR